MKKKKLCKSRTIKAPDWHLEKSLHHISKVISHMEESGYGSIKAIDDLEKYRLAISQLLTTELKRKKGVVS